MSEKTAKWLRLDNSAKIFPMMADKQNQNLFNIFIRLNEDVDKQLLQRALEITIKRFPSINVMLKRGVFWFYFEEHGGKPLVYDADPIVMKKISSSNCRGFCFRISCYKNVIFADFFHAVTDGTGAAEFIKSLLFTYFTLKGYPVDGEQKVLTVGSPVNPREYEDSFLTNYKKKKIKDLTISSLKGKKSYRISGIRFDNAGKGVINMYAPAKQFVTVCREHNCTVTEMIGALFMLSVYETKIKPQSLPPQDIQLFVPINLRKIFTSVTLRNFSLFSRIGVSASDEMTLESLTKTIHECLKRDTQKEVLSDKISTTVYAEKFLPMRILPLFLKRVIFKISNLFFGKNKKTATFSSVGVVSLPESFRPYIKDMGFGITANNACPVTITAATVYDTMCINFTRTITDTEIEKRFARYLTDFGIDLKVTSNFWEVDDDALQIL